jgi:hypothetical protein
VLAARIEDVDRRLTELQTFRDVLTAHLRACEGAIQSERDDCPTIAAIGRTETEETTGHEDY